MKKFMETKTSEGRKNSKVYAGGKEYYQYLKDLKRDTENDEYSASFMLF